MEIIIIVNASSHRSFYHGFLVLNLVIRRLKARLKILTLRKPIILPVQIPSSVNVDVDVNPVNYAMIAGLSVASFIIMILVVVLIVQCYAFYCRRHCMMTEGPRYRVVTETTVNDDL